MTKIECIILLGGILTKLDVRRGSMKPRTPSRKFLDKLRNEISDRQIELADLLFDETTAIYTETTQTLEKAISEIETELDDVDNILKLSVSGTALLSIIDNFFLLAIDIV